MATRKIGLHDVRRKQVPLSPIRTVGGIPLLISTGQNQEGPHFELRPATHLDSKFIYDLRCAGMREHVSRVPGWSAEYQEAVLMDFDPLQHQIIIMNGREVGAMSAVVHPDHVYFAQLHLLPEAQGKGIGSAITREVNRYAHSRGMWVWGQTIRTNIVQLKMLQRAGWKIVGETKDRLLVACEPPEPHAQKGGPSDPI